jgi:hypothetical protein
MMENFGSGVESKASTESTGKIIKVPAWEGLS